MREVSPEPRHASLAALGVFAVLLASCGGPEEIDLRPVERPETESAPGCFGGVEVARAPARLVFAPPPGWILVRTECGRCEGTRVPVGYRAVLQTGAQRRELASYPIPPSSEGMRRQMAFITYVGPRSTLVLEAFEPGADDDPSGLPAVFFVNPSFTLLPRRPDALPSDTRSFSSNTGIDLAGEELHARLPATLRVATRPGVHTLLGELGVLTEPRRPVRLLVQRESGPNEPVPLLTWERSTAWEAPVTVSFASDEPGTVTLSLGGPMDAVSVWRDVRLLSRDFAVMRPTADEPTETPLVQVRRPSLGEQLSRLVADGVTGDQRCGVEDAFVVPPPSLIEVPVSAGPHRIRGSAGPCAPTRAGRASWRIETAAGVELLERELEWAAGGEPRSDFDLEADFPSPSTLRFVTEGAEPGTPTAWAAVLVVLRADLTVRASGFNESDLNRSYAPENAVDSQIQTEWHLPNSTSGWLEIALDEPRDLRGIAITNGHNAGYEDRATRAFTVRAYADDNSVLGEVHAEFAAFEADPIPRIVRLQARGVARLSVEVESWFREGAPSPRSSCVESSAHEVCQIDGGADEIQISPIARSLVGPK